MDYGHRGASSLEACASPVLAPSTGRPAHQRETLGLVLVAENNIGGQLVAAGLLEGLEYAVKVAANGLEAVAAMTASADRVAVVLMNCRMPRLDGYDATRLIRQHEQPGARIPIIAMSETESPEERRRCLDAGMDDFLLKPLNFERLECTLSHWLEGTDRDSSQTPGDVTGVLDLTRIQMLRELRAGDCSFFIKCLDSFSSRVPDDIDAIDAAVQNSDHPGLVAAAHAMKGSALNIGAVELGRLCQALEDAGERRDTVNVQALAGALPERAAAAVLALRSQSP